MLKEDLKKGIGIPEWAVLQDSEYSDLAFPCFSRAKETGKNPNDIAKEIAGGIKTAGLVKKVEAVNGYVNIYLNKGAALVKEAEAGKKLVKTNFSGKTVFLEHTSVNPNKALHLGHVRNSFIGEFVRRAIELSGGKVITTNFVEDTGSQVADVLVAFKYLGKDVETKDKFDSYCSRIYKEVNEEYEKKPELKEKRSEILKKIEAGDSDVTGLLKKVVNRVLAAQIKTLKANRIKYDMIDLESHILGEGLIKEALQKLEETGLVFESTEGETKGCLIIRLDGKDRILRRSDGTLLYVAKDIAYAFWKHNIIKKKIKYSKFSENFDGSPILISDTEGEEKVIGEIDESITLTDSEQDAEQAVVKTTIGAVNRGGRYTHYSYEQVALSQKTGESLGLKTDGKFARMSGRKGITVEVDSLIEEIKNRIKGAAGSGEMSDEDAFKLGSNIVKYSLLRMSPSKMVVFDMDEAMSIKGDTAMYINYTYARAKNILKKLGDLPKKKDIDLDEKESLLVKKMIFVDDAIFDAINNLRPSVLCERLHGLCDEFNTFYESSRVAGSGREAERGAIVHLFAKNVEKLTELLGLFLLETV